VIHTGKLLHTIHFYIGKESSIDEKGTAAYKTVELDDLLESKLNMQELCMKQKRRWNMPLQRITSHFQIEHVAFHTFCAFSYIFIHDSTSMHVPTLVNCSHSIFETVSQHPEDGEPKQVREEMGSLSRC
jgi:hypothetical protein